MTLESATYKRIQDIPVDVAMKEIHAALIARYPFHKSDEILPSVDSDQVFGAIEDAFNEINSEPPQTFYSIQDMFYGSDTRWKSLLITGTCSKLLRARMLQWTIEGYSSPIDEMPLEDKEEKYEKAWSLIDEDFRDKLVQLKATSQKFVKRANVGRANPITRPTTFLSGRIFYKGR